MPLHPQPNDEKAKKLIGSGLHMRDKVPRFEHRDPRPDLPFVTPDLPTLSEALVWLALVALLGGLCYLLLWLPEDIFLWTR